MERLADPERWLSFLPHWALLVGRERPAWLRRHVVDLAPGLESYYYQDLRSWMVFLGGFGRVQPAQNHPKRIQLRNS